VAGHFTASGIKYDSYMNNFNIKQIWFIYITTTTATTTTTTTTHQ